MSHRLALRLGQSYLVTANFRDTENSSVLLACVPGGAKAGRLNEFSAFLHSTHDLAPAPLLNAKIVRLCLFASLIDHSKA